MNATVMYGCNLTHALCLANLTSVQLKQEDPVVCKYEGVLGRAVSEQMLMGKHCTFFSL